MARPAATFSVEEKERLQISLPRERIEIVEGTTYFAVEVMLSDDSPSWPVSWEVHRRYSDFLELRSRLRLGEDSIPGVAFPPKLILGCAGARLEERRWMLEAWLQAVLGWSVPVVQMGRHLSKFLNEGWRPADQYTSFQCNSFQAPSPLSLSGCRAPRPVAVGGAVRSPRNHSDDPRRGALSWPPLSRARSELWGHLRHESEELGEVSRRCSYNFPCCMQTTVERSRGDRKAFEECAKLIAKDIPRTFSGNTMVDRIRLRIAEVLRDYAQKDEELGYTQGMNFVAAMVCLRDSGPAADRMFEGLIGRLRGLWLPDLPLLAEAIPPLQLLLEEKDPDIVEHLNSLGVDLVLVLPRGWLTLFGGWLPLQTAVELLPFLMREGLSAVLAITLLLLLHHRCFVLDCRSFEDVLDFFGNLPNKPPPEGLLIMCVAALPRIEACTKVPRDYFLPRD